MSNRLNKIYEQWAGKQPAHIVRMAGAGSNREYYRIVSEEGESVIGVIGTSKEENHAFITLTRHFADAALPVPKVLGVGDDEMCYLLTDLGDMALFDALAAGRKAGGNYNEAEVELLKRAMRLLPKIQVAGARNLDFSVCYPQPEFDETNVMFDLNYFKYCFLKPSGVDFHEMRLEEDFRRMAKDLTGDKGNYFMYRDFQARNIMLDEDGNPYLIDYQGGRKGPFYYDVASFLWQASARYPDSLRKELIKEYYSVLSQYTDVPEQHAFMQRLNLFVFFRTLQVLGAYGYRGYFERKKHFIDSIPPALDNLRALLKNEMPYPHLVEVLRGLVKNAKAPLSSPEGDTCPLQHDVRSFSSALNNTSDNTLSASNLSTRQLVNSSTSQPQNLITSKPPALTVRVFSFSYKKGMPEDTSGNGGGYVFDCRSTHNPGRYEPYKQLTGLDQPVIQFLEDDGEISVFLESVYKLADAHVERYMQRGFTDLMFSFGCTGGQHRSVYSAQHLAEHLNEKYGIEVKLCHREQGISRVLERRSDASLRSADGCLTRKCLLTPSNSF
ncbi:MAG: phosphotransferase [Prevotella sp.]|nr:phosphotransferase [Prevotella sp.]